MKVFIKNATILCPPSPFHGKNKDIFIDKGIISKIGNNLKVSANKTIDVKGLHV